MRIINKKIIKEYLLPIVLFPIFWIVIKYTTSVLFQMGTIYGTFIRKLFEEIINSM